MKFLKTIGLIVLFISLTTNLQAQQKQSYAEKNAFEKTEYVANEMNLNKDQKTFLHKVLLNKMETTAEKINGKDLSEEEKKAIHKQSYLDTNKKLLEQFSKDETKTIFALMKAFNATNKK